MFRVFTFVLFALSFSLSADEAHLIKVSEFELEYEIAGNGKHTVLLEAGDGSPQGRAVLTENSGHFVQFDEPDLVLAELQRLISILQKDE